MQAHRVLCEFSRLIPLARIVLLAPPHILCAALFCACGRMPPLRGGMGLGIPTGDSLQRRPCGPSLLPHGRGACRRPKERWGTSSVPRSLLGFSPPSPDQGCGPGPGVGLCSSCGTFGYRADNTGPLWGLVFGLRGNGGTGNGVTPPLRCGRAAPWDLLVGFVGRLGEGFGYEMREPASLARGLSRLIILAAFQASGAGR